MKLCESVDVFSGSSQVQPGGKAYFAIWLSASGANIDGLTITLVTKPTSAAPHFTVCPSGHTKTCAISSLNTGTSELQAAVAIPQSAANGEHVTLEAKVTSTKPKIALSASATVTVAVPAHSPANTATSSPTATGSGALNLSGNSLPLVPVGPVSPITSVSAGANIGSLLPSIPATTPNPSAAQAPFADGAAAPAASVNPLNRRLMGTQLIALAALCAAVGIVIAKLTLRTPRPAVSAATASGGTPGAGAAPATAAAESPAAAAAPATQSATATAQDSAAAQVPAATGDATATGGAATPDAGEAPSSDGEPPIPPSPGAT